jgi:UDP-N-acetylglucosamine 2-epimerase (non-hydrolysing)
MKNWDKIQNSQILKKLGLEKDKYFVLSSHREENVNDEKHFNMLIESINAIVEEYGLPIIFSTHPRTRKMIEQKNVKLSNLVKLLKPLSFSDYVKLQINAKAVLSDSGTISEETSILKLKALNIREAHERPEAMEEATVMMVGLKKERILQGLAILEKQTQDTIKITRDYDVENVSEKVLRIIMSYTDYIKRVVWQRMV